jgi:SAM-dependent methyltransferase
MAVTAAGAYEWADYVDEEFVFADFPPGSRVLDVGFGGAEQLRRLRRLGHRPVGIEVDPALAAGGRRFGLAVCRAQAERLPFATGSMDGVVCKVVIPYTDDALAVSEIARVLRPGATARISYQGAGYFLRYLITDRHWKMRLYGLRTLINTAGYAVTGQRLPGFWGDTLFQSERRLRRYYAQCGLELVEARPAPRFARAPVFIYHVLRRTQS